MTAQLLKSAAVVAAAAFAVPASAGVIDFTAAPVGSALTSGTVDGIAFSVTSSGGTLNNTQAFDGALAAIDTSAGTIASQLAFASDGHGAGDDEISSTAKRTETITVTFGSAVRVLGFAFLDLFKVAAGGTAGEYAMMTTSTGETVSLFATDSGQSTDPGFGGYAEIGGLTGLLVTSLTFTVGSQNDNVGVADGALAAIWIAPVPVPVPATGLLILSALSAAAAVRSRRRNAA